tara:strand:+ start:626 stop:727 length:102 start_codon:yes stop_codon:yes gene_type:complete
MMGYYAKIRLGAGRRIKNVVPLLELFSMVMLPL